MNLNNDLNKSNIDLEYCNLAMEFLKRLEFGYTMSQHLMKEYYENFVDIKWKHPGSCGQCIKEQKEVMKSKILSRIHELNQPIYVENLDDVKLVGSTKEKGKILIGEVEGGEILVEVKEIERPKNKRQSMIEGGLVECCEEKPKNFKKRNGK